MIQECPESLKTAALSSVQEKVRIYTLCTNSVARQAALTCPACCIFHFLCAAPQTRHVRTRAKCGNKQHTCTRQGCAWDHEATPMKPVLVEF